MDSRKWCATDTTGRVVQTMDISWPDGHPDPDGEMDNVRATIESRGLVFHLLGPDDVLPEAGMVWNGAEFVVPEPTPAEVAHSAEQALDETARLSMKGNQATRDKLRAVAKGEATFTAAERDRAIAYIMLQFLNGNGG